MLRFEVCTVDNRLRIGELLLCGQRTLTFDLTHFQLYKSHENGTIVLLLLPFILLIHQNQEILDFVKCQNFDLHFDALPVFQI